MENDNLTAAQRRAIAALLQTSTVAAAAQQAKVGERTLFRWLAEPDFKRALNDAERELIATATRRLLQYQEAAITVIVSIMADKTQRPGVRLRAAMAIVDYMLRLRDLNSIEERLSALEDTYARQTN